MEGDFQCRIPAYHRREDIVWKGWERIVVIDKMRQAGIKTDAQSPAAQLIFHLCDTPELVLFDVYVWKLAQ